MKGLRFMVPVVVGTGSSSMKGIQLSSIIVAVAMMGVACGAEADVRWEAAAEAKEARAEARASMASGGRASDARLEMSD